MTYRYRKNGEENKMEILTERDLRLKEALAYNTCAGKVKQKVYTEDNKFAAVVLFNDDRDARGYYSVLLNLGHTEDKVQIVRNKSYMEVSIEKVERDENTIVVYFYDKERGGDVQKTYFLTKKMTFKKLTS